DEMPIQAGDLHGLVAALAVVESPPDPEGYDSQINHTRRDVQAMKSGDHEETRPELRRPPWICPGPDSFDDDLGPFERLHTDEGGAEPCGHQHQRRGLGAMAAVAEVDGHRHCPAAGDQHHGHDRDQDERNVRIPDLECEDFARVWPGHGGGYPYIHVRSQET